MFLTVLTILVFIYFETQKITAHIGYLEINFLYFSLTLLFFSVLIKYIASRYPIIVKTFVATLGIVYLIFSFFTARTRSFDGLVTYLKYIYSTSIDYNFSVRLLNPVRPHLIEMLLGLLLKHTFFNLINFIFGLVGIISICVVYYFIKQAGYSKKVAQFATLILLASPLSITKKFFRNGTEA